MRYYFQLSLLWFLLVLSLFHLTYNLLVFHNILYPVLRNMYIMQCIVHFTVYTVYYSAYYSVYTVYFSVHCTFYTV